MDTLGPLFEEYGLLVTFAAVLVEQLLYLGIGLVFSKQIDRALVLVEQSGKVAILVIAAASAVYYILKLWRRRSSVKASK